MTIKQSEAAKAFHSLQDLNSQKLSSGKLAKSIYDLFTKIQSAYDFQMQEEQKIFGNHPSFNPVLGGIPYTEDMTPEEKENVNTEIKQIESELKDLAELDFELEGYEPFTINLDLEPNLRISGEDIGNLEKLIVFN